MNRPSMRLQKGRLPCRRMQCAARCAKACQEGQADSRAAHVSRCGGRSTDRSPEEARKQRDSRAWHSSRFPHNRQSRSEPPDRIRVELPAGGRGSQKKKEIWRGGKRGLTAQNTGGVPDTISSATNVITERGVTAYHRSPVTGTLSPRVDASQAGGQQRLLGPTLCTNFHRGLPPTKRQIS